MSRMFTLDRRCLSGRLAAMLCLAAGASVAQAQIATVVTTDSAALASALHPSGGLVINSVVVRNGKPGQIGTFAKFDLPPVSIRDGVVLSSGSVENLTPLAEVLDPAYDSCCPPARVNSQMTFDTDPDGNFLSGGTDEFDAYGSHANNIENFSASFDVAAIDVHFTLPVASQVRFDFIFGSVEFPYYTSSFTDAFLVFLDGTQPNDQVTFDANNAAVQVGVSFAGLETTADVNTAFAAPHGLIHHLTTTTAELAAGEHTLTFEVGDVNDHILDSVVFIADLRAQAGVEGTHPSDDCRGDYDHSGTVTVSDLFDFLDRWFIEFGLTDEDQELTADFTDNGVVAVDDLFGFLDAWFAEFGTCGES